MNVLYTKLPGVLLIEPDVFGDERCFFLETFHSARYSEEAGIVLPFVQDNHSRSKKGILRGLHFQKKKPQGKLVRCILGEVFDVVVDINIGSSTYGKWEGFHLSGDNKNKVWIPPGYAHGFLVLSETADFEYKCTDYYDSSDEGCLLWNDATVNVDWPLKEQPLLSPKDKLGSPLLAL